MGKFGDKVTADWMLTKKGRTLDWAGAKNALVFYDLSTQYKAVYAAARRNKLTTLEAFDLFSPGKGSVNTFRCDGGRELIAAAREKGWPVRTSTPHVSKSNGVAERCHRTIVEGAKTILFQAGMGAEMWPFAARHFAISSNVCEESEGTTPWIRRHGQEFPAKMIPFGALKWTSMLLSKSIPSKWAWFQESSWDGTWILETNGRATI